MSRVKKADKKAVLGDIQANLIRALLEHQSTHLLSHKQMYDIAEVSRMTWFRWTTGRVKVPKSMIETLIRRFKLDGNKIMGIEVTCTDMHYKEFFDYGEEYKAYIRSGKPNAAIQVMRRAGAIAFDILHSHGFSVDCIISNRLEGYKDSVHLFIFLGDRKLVLEMTPSTRLAYKFYVKKSGEEQVLHDGTFSNSILKAILEYLESERVAINRTKKKDDIDIANLIRKSRELESKSAYE